MKHQIRSVSNGSYQYRIRIVELKKRSWFGLGPKKTVFIWVLEAKSTDMWEDISISKTYKTREEAVKKGHAALDSLQRSECQYLTYGDFTGLPSKVAHWECIVKERDGDSVWCHAHALDGSGDIEFWELEVKGNLWEEGYAFYVIGERLDREKDEDLPVDEHSLPHFQGSTSEEGFGFIVTMDEL